MSLRSKVQMLPLELKQWIDKSLVEGNFTQYALLESELAKHGYKIHQSSIKRYGLKLERKLAALKTGTEAATAIAEATRDDAGQSSAAIISLLESEMFDVLVALPEAKQDDDPTERLKLLGHGAKIATELSRASINQKKWQAQEQRDARIKAEIAEAAAKEDNSKGISSETIRRIRTVLGIRLDDHDDAESKQIDSG